MARIQRFQEAIGTVPFRHFFPQSRIELYPTVAWFAVDLE